MHRKLVSLALGLAVGLGVFGASAPTALAATPTVISEIGDPFEDPSARVPQAGIAPYIWQNLWDENDATLWAGWPPLGGTVLGAGWPDQNGGIYGANDSMCAVTAFRILQGVPSHAASSYKMQGRSSPYTGWLDLSANLTAIDSGIVQITPTRLQGARIYANGGPAVGWEVFTVTFYGVCSTTVDPLSLLGFNGDCTAGFETIPRTQYNALQVGPYTAVKGDAYARLLYPCVMHPGDVVGYEGASYVLPANLQGAGSQIVQVGYGQTDCNTPPCFWGAPDDGVPHFVYTQSDTGALAYWATWFQGGTPWLGHQYRFSIEPKKVQGSWYWNYCIQDLTPGYEGVGCIARLRSWATGSGAWWGYEVVRTTDALGVGAGEPGIAMNNLQYKTSSWAQKSGANLCSNVINPRDWWHCDTATTTIANDTINGYTTLH